MISNKYKLGAQLFGITVGLLTMGTVTWAVYTHKQLKKSQKWWRDAAIIMDAQRKAFEPYLKSAAERNREETNHEDR